MMSRIMAYMREIILLMGRYSKRVPLLLVVGMVIGVVDIVGLGLVAQFVGTMLGATNQPIPFLSENSGSGYWLGVLLVVIFLLRACLGIFSYWYISITAGKVEANLKSELLLHYQRMSYEERMRRGESELVNAINLWASQYVRIVLIPLARTISDALIGLMILAFLGYASFTSLALFFVLIGSVGLLYDQALKKRGQKYARIFRTVSTQTVSDVQQGLEGYKEIRVFGLENFFQARIKQSVDVMSSALAKTSTISQSPRLIIEAVIVLFVVISIYVAQGTLKGGTDFLPIMAMFAVGGIRIIGVAGLASGVIFNLRLYRPVIKQLAADYLDSASDKQAKSDTKKNLRFEKMDVNGLTFTYRNFPKPVLNAISFSCVAGESLAIVGESGSGKTTLVDLLLGILEPSSGNIVVHCEGGTQQSTLTGVASYLSQTTFILNDTLRKNVALGCETIDDERVIAALAKAKLQLFANADSLEMVLGDRGGRISGGQRQRVALARAFYLNRNVLILDEATNALDLQTETDIIKDLLELKDEITLIVITHRPEIARLFARKLTLTEGSLR